MTEPEASSPAVRAYDAYRARLRREHIPAYEPIVGEPELRNLADVVRRNWLSEGAYTREFEQRLAVLGERRHAIACGNATSALIAGMRAAGIGPGDEVVAPSLAHPADPNAIAATGATPVFADVDERTLCLSAETVAAVRTPRTKAVLLVSAYGNAADLDALAAYARTERLLLINDCAAALGSRYRGRAVAAYGAFAAFSFFADKTITTGEGGAFLTDDGAIAQEFNYLKHDGRQERGHDVIERRGYNLRMTELQSAVGVAQLDRLPTFLARKRAILARYRDHLAGIPEVTVFPFHPDGEIVPHRVLIMVPDAHALIAHCSRCGIGVRTLFMPMHAQPSYGETKEFPITERLYARGVCLPSAPSLTDTQIERVSSAIRGFFHAEEP